MAEKKSPNPLKSPLSDELFNHPLISGLGIMENITDLDFVASRNIDQKRGDHTELLMLVEEKTGVYSLEDIKVYRTLKPYKNEISQRYTLSTIDTALRHVASVDRYEDRLGNAAREQDFVFDRGFENVTLLYCGLYVIWLDKKTIEEATFIAIEKGVWGRFKPVEVTREDAIDFFKFEMEFQKEWWP
jgi:hypothetical protein